MEALRRSILGEWKVEQYFQYEPEYQSLHQRLERHRMRQEEVTHLAEQRFSEKLSAIMSGGDVSGGEGEHEIIRVHRSRLEEYQSPRGGHLEPEYHPLSMIEPKRTTRRKNKKGTLERIVEERGNEAEQADQPLQRIHSEA